MDTNEKAPRIGRQVQHFERVDIEKIEATFQGSKYRYGLSLPYKIDPASRVLRTKIAVIVLKNPSSADAHLADKTIRTAAHVIYHSFPDVGYVEVLNLFSLRATDAQDLQAEYDRQVENGEEIDVGMVGSNRLNTTHFKAILGSADYCIFAWGGRSAVKKKLYDHAISNFKEILASIELPPVLYRKAEKGNTAYPFHACFWPHNDVFIEIK